MKIPHELLEHYDLITLMVLKDHYEMCMEFHDTYKYPQDKKDNAVILAALYEVIRYFSMKHDFEAWDKEVHSA